MREMTPYEAMVWAETYARARRDELEENQAAAEAADEVAALRLVDASTLAPEASAMLRQMRGEG